MHSTETSERDEPAYSDDGVDLTLIRWMLSLTPAERLSVLQQYVDSVLNIRAWNSATRLPPTAANPARRASPVFVQR
jgi:hypothetical protein